METNTVKYILAKHILEILTHQEFAQWYGADMNSDAPFSDWIGGSSHMTELDILKDIIRIFKL